MVESFEQIPGDDLVEILKAGIGSDLYDLRTHEVWVHGSVIKVYRKRHSGRRRLVHVYNSSRWLELRIKDR